MYAYIGLAGVGVRFVRFAWFCWRVYQGHPLFPFSVSTWLPVPSSLVFILFGASFAQVVGDGSVRGGGRLHGVNGRTHRHWTQPRTANRIIENGISHDQ